MSAAPSSLEPSGCYSAPRPAIRTFVVDEAAEVSEYVHALCRAESHICCVGEAETLEEVRDGLRTKNVDVLLVSGSLPGDGATDVVEAVTAEFSGIRCIVLAGDDDTADATRAIAAGAFGYVTRTSTLESLSEAVHAAVEGRVHMSHRMARKVLARILFTDAAPMRSDAGTLSSTLRLDRLSDRELQVFQLLSEGNTPSQIAERLGVQSRTVRLHLRHIQRKLEARDYADVLKLSAEWQGRAHGVVLPLPHRA